MLTINILFIVGNKADWPAKLSENIVPVVFQRMGPKITELNGV